MKLLLKLSDLLQLAFDDLLIVSKDDRYTLHMEKWHEPATYTGTCYVCMAGAVMANTMKVPVDMSDSPLHYKNQKWFLLAIDSMRIGNPERALIFVLGGLFSAERIARHVIFPESCHTRLAHGNTFDPVKIRNAIEGYRSIGL